MCVSFQSSTGFSDCSISEVMCDSNRMFLERDVLITRTFDTIEIGIILGTQVLNWGTHGV
jgi:hypothetical protein